MHFFTKFWNYTFRHEDISRKWLDSKKQNAQTLSTTGLNRFLLENEFAIHTSLLGISSQWILHRMTHLEIEYWPLVCYAQQGRLGVRLVIS
jgi:hypothetical protein